MKRQDINWDSRRWVVLVASCLVNLCIGSIYAWSVFAAPLAAKLTQALGTQFSPADLAIVFTIANSVGPITMISGGYVNDKLGPKLVIMIGGAMFGLGMILSGLVGSIPMLIVTYGLIAGLGLGMTYGCTINNTVKFFPDKRGLVGGIATATYGLSSVIVPPVANSMIDSQGVSMTFVILGAVFLVVILGSALFIDKCPVGYRPAGFDPSARRAAKALSEDRDWRQMLSSPVFYVMIAMLICGAFSGLMITSQASPMAQKMVGMTPALAATAVSVLALFNAGGRIVAGVLSDKFGRVAVLMGAFVLEFAGLALLLTAADGTVIRFMMGISLIGICFGALMGVYPGFTADQFGARHNSVNYGIMFIGFALAGYFGPTVARKILLAQGSYSPAFLVAICFAAAGLALAVTFVLMQRKRRPLPPQA